MIQNLLDLFNYQVATAFGAPVSLIEVVGFITGAICVYWVAKQNVWNWPIGIVNNFAFGVLFFGVGLYAETVLQGIFAVIAFYGWYKWIYGGGQARNSLPVRLATRKEVLGLGSAAVVGTAAVALMLMGGTDSEVPFWDALILSLSLVATYTQAAKIRDGWAVWILVDLVSVPLYASRGLYLTAILYTGFLGLCVYGYIDWQRSYRKQQDNAVTLSTADLAVQTA